MDTNSINPVASSRRGEPSPVTEYSPVKSATAGQKLPAEAQSLPPVAGSGSNFGAPSTNDQALGKAVSKISSQVQNLQRDLQFSIEEELPLGRAVITVLDRETQEVIRRIPSEEALAIARQLEDITDSSTGSVEGLLLKTEA